MKSVALCELCGAVNNLLICSRCKDVYYCCKEHQITDWINHKPKCINGKHNRKNNKVNSPKILNHFTKYSSPLIQKSPHRMQVTEHFTAKSNSEEEGIIQTEQLKPKSDYLEKDLFSHSNNNVMNRTVVQPVPDKENLGRFSHICFQNEDTLSTFYKRNSTEEQDCLDILSRQVIQDMSVYGVCVVDNFLGKEKGSAVLKEVLDIHHAGLFKDGQLVSNKLRAGQKSIRSDQVAWIDGREPSCHNIGSLISRIDAVILKANTMENNGKMGDYKINGRTKAMVACYPGHGSRYVTHVDNPNVDGRCITAIYYLNEDWDVEKDGGLLRIFPVDHQETVADIVPIFDRLLFFWSDRRNPHEVQPVFRRRYAITMWYFDAAAREEAFSEKLIIK